MRRKQTRRDKRSAAGSRSARTRAPRRLRAWLHWRTWSQLVNFNLQPSTFNAPRQGGAVIIVVLALLTTLMVLGLYHMRWVGYEKVNAESFVGSDPTELDPDPIWGVALRQVLVSVPDEYPLSALNAEGIVSGNTRNITFWSLLAHQLGAINADGSPTDLQPHNGRGISVGAGPVVDYDGNSTTTETLRLNLSRMATGAQFDIVTANPNYFFQPDAGYTYPDINSFFLALDYFDPANPSVKVVKPSFTLPRYFASPTTGPANTQSLRVHAGHGVTNVRGYVTGAPVAANSGNRNRIIPAYSRDFSTERWGVWSNPANVTEANTYNLDKDLDGDGIPDSIDMDLGHPIIDLPDGRQVVPIFQFKITDLDGLININLAGNQALITALSNQSGAVPQSVYTSASWTHQSNLGLSRSEINPLFALRADPQDTNFIDTADAAWATAPLLAWVADRSSATPDVATLIGTYGALNRLKAANIELARMLYGAPEFFASDLTYAGTSQLVGRYGVDSPITVMNFLGNASASSGSVPSPGAANLDDDVNDLSLVNNPATSYAASVNGHGGRAYIEGGTLGLDNKLRNVYVPPFVHPLDFTGAGDLNGSTGATFRRDSAIVGGTLGANDLIGERITGAINANSPVRWPQYPNVGGVALYQDQGTSTDAVYNDTSLYSALNYKTLRQTSLQAGSATDLLWNHPNEMNQYSDLGSGSDSRFSPSEIAALQLSDADWNRLGSASQLRKLLPFNFENNKQAARIRSHFTTDSWDRKEFSHAPFNHPTNRQWEFNNPVNLTGLGLGTYNTFPPQFGTVLASRHDRLIETPVYLDVTSPLIGTISAADPFRPEVRRLLTTFTSDALVASNLRDRFPRHKLNMNRILSDDVSSGGAGAFDQYGNPKYRELVPHITEATSLTAALDAMVHENPTTTLVSGLAATHALNRFDDLLAGTAPPQVQEWWARYDRQRLARDIYVLLYTLGGGDDAFNPTAGGYPAAPDVDSNGVNDLVQQMAQFAVNYVDALDRDNCITKFVYDPNLSDGWATSGLEAAYGVEAQQLTFSEALLVKAPKQMTDFATTLFDESQDDHRWLYLELRNVSPFPVRLTEGFRIMRLDTSSGPEIPLIAAELIPVGSAHKQVDAGENYTIGCHDGFIMNGAGQPIGSEFIVDYINGPELEYVIPKGVSLMETNNSAQPAINQFDFDLTARDDGTTTDDEFVAWYTPPGSPWTGARLVERTAGGGSTQDEKATFALQRRLNPNLTWTPATLDDAEWVEVDRISLSRNQQYNTGTLLDMYFSPASDAQADVASALTRVKSMERLHHFTYSIYQNPGIVQQNHSLHSRTAAASVKHDANDYTIANLPASMPDATDMRIWQPHFDRDFSSAMELLSIPLYGLRYWEENSADPVTANTNVGPVFPIDAWAPIGGVTYNLVDNSSLAQVGRLAGFNTAQLRFLFPSGTPPAGHPFESKAQASYLANRWFRLFNFVDIPDSADDVVETALRYQKRTPGKISLNTFRQEAVFAALVDDDVHHDAQRDNISHPGNPYDPDRPTKDALDAARNWMTELQRVRDVANPSGVYLPGDPTSKPFRPFSWIDPAVPDDSVQSSILRPHGASSAFPNLQLFEARGDDGLSANSVEVDYHTRHRLLGKVANNSTVRSHVFAMWVGFDLHEAHVNAGGQVQIGGKATDLPSYRMFCVVDMSRLEEAYDPVTGTFDYRKFIIHSQLLP